MHVVGELRAKHGDELTEECQPPPRDEQTKCGTATRRDTFGHEQTDQASAIGAERQTERHLSRPVHATCEHHAADVRAGDEQHQASQRADNRDESGDCDRSQPATGQRLRVEAVPSIVLGILAGEVARNPRHLCSRLRSASTPSFSRPMPMSHC